MAGPFTRSIEFVEVEPRRPARRLEEEKFHNSDLPANGHIDLPPVDSPRWNAVRLVIQGAEGL